MARVLLIASFLFVTSTATELPSDMWLERGAEALRPFKMQLKAELMEGMKSGTANAIDVCAVRAPEIAEGVGSETVLVGRTSHKLRNPANAPRPWMRPLLQAYLDDPQDRTPKVVTLEAGGVGYVEPIIAQPLCLTCHGTSITDATREALAGRYPEDEATGFEKGDLRGLFWVEFRD